MKCKHCTRTTTLGEQNARLSGWRIWRGKTLGGQEKEDIVCPTCVGDVKEGEKPVGWSVGCHTCDWEWDDESDGGGPLSERDAKDEAFEHVCEPDTYLISPEEMATRKQSQADLARQFAAARAAVIAPARGSR